MAQRIGKTQDEQLQQLRGRLGNTTFQRIQREVWTRFSRQPPPTNSDGTLAPLALFGIWDELIEALREGVKRQVREREATSRMQATGGLLWELLKDGVRWSATLNVRSEHPGWEVVVTRKGRRFHTYQFLTREKAEAWADKECIEIAMGWKE